LITEKEKIIFNYIAVLEDVNNQLLLSLKRCVDVLARFKDHVPDPDQWQTLLDLFDATIKEGEKVVLYKTTLH